MQMLRQLLTSKKKRMTVAPPGFLYSQKWGKEMDHSAAKIPKSAYSNQDSKIPALLPHAITFKQMALAFTSQSLCLPIFDSCVTSRSVDRVIKH